MQPWLQPILSYRFGWSFLKLKLVNKKQNVYHKGNEDGQREIFIWIAMATEQAIITAFFAFHLSSLSLTEPLETLNVHPKDETEQKCYFKFDRFLAQLKTLL